MPRILTLSALSFLSFCLVSVASSCAAEADAGAKPVDFSREIKPLLAAKCYACHGPDGGKRKGDLRLDVKTDALKKILKPGEGGQCELERINLGDADHVMPPKVAKTGPLSPQQIDLLQRWVDQGEIRLALGLRQTRAPAPPEVKNKEWVKNAIDAFIAAGQEHAGPPARPAGRTA